MDCNICFEDFNQESRIPKVLPCGHTICLQCLLQSDRRECPTCRRAFNSPPSLLPTNFVLLRLMESAPDGGVSAVSCPPTTAAPLSLRHSASEAPGWCSACRAPATPRCRDRDGHSVVSAKTALSRHLPEGVLQRAAGQLEDLLRQCEEPLTLLTLLTAGAWDVTLRSHSGERVMAGTVTDTDDPVIKLMWLALAARAGVSEIRPSAPPPPPQPECERESAAAPTPSNAGRRPGPPTAPKPSAAVRKLSPVRLPLRMLDVDKVSNTGPNEWQELKEVLAQVEARGVSRLTGVSCSDDPDWSLRLLRVAAPTVVNLSLTNPSKAHIREVLAMPRLTRLSVWSSEAAQHGTRPRLLLPPGEGALRWLRVGGYGLPRATLQSVLQANSHTLQELWLTVGTAGSEEWPWSCSDLHVLLKRCWLRELTKLVLHRWDGYTSSHTDTDCYQQRISVQEVLPRPGAAVLCSRCDVVDREDF
ncbi:Roquin-2 [Frankliniella fusca]|uniref:Roquin-2 n=1 Tax=Frankliniella fusca TaxID=407009 RepID=A0AAE1HKF9_9NEOP|nr:Roquin-2 [Frankliniella fusca]